MITFSEVAVIIVLFIILMMALAKNPICPKEFKTEQFDTYYNHDMGTHTVYQKGLFGAEPDISIEEADLKRKYDWSQRDPAGVNVYDDYYEALVHEKNSGFKREYDYQETSEEPYDEKFNDVPNDRGYDWNKMWEGIEERTYFHPILHGTKRRNTDAGKFIEGGVDYLSDRPDTDVLEPGYDVFLSQKGKH